MEHENDRDLISALGTIPKGLVKRPESMKTRGQVETLQID